MKKDSLTFGAKINCTFATIAAVLALAVWFGFQTAGSLSDSLESATGKTLRRIELAGILNTAESDMAVGQRGVVMFTYAKDSAAIFDPFGNAVHTALSFPVLGEDVLVAGAGPIGIMAAAIARHAGARYVVITDVNEYRLDLARKMGVTEAVDIRERTLPEIQKKLGMTEGFDVGLEMSGNQAAFRDMLANMSHGAKIAMLGIPEGDMAIDWRTVIFNMLTVKGIYGREMYETWYKMTVMLQSGLDITPVITHRFHYTEFERGFDVMSSGQSGKVILNWQ